MDIQPPNLAPQVSLNLDTQNIATTQQQVQRLPVGVTLMGMVAGNDKNGNLIIRLAGNDLILSSPLALGKNAQVALKIENVSGTYSVQLLSVDGKLPPTQAQAVSNQLMQNPQQQTPQQAAQQQAQLQQQGLPLKLISAMPPGQAKVFEAAPQAQAPVIPKSDIVSLSSPQTGAIRGTIITTTPEIVQNLRASINLASPLKGDEVKRLIIPDDIKPGSQLNLKIMSQTPPPQNPQQQEVQTDNRSLGKQDWMNQQQQPEDTPENLQTPKAPIQQTAQQAQQQPQQNEGTIVRQQLREFIPTSKGLPNGNIELNALVIDSKLNGEMLVETKIGKVIVQGGQQFSNIQKGSTLTLELQEFTGGQKVIIKLPEGELPIQQLAREWPALKTLQQFAPNIGQNFLPEKLAGLEGNFAARLAGFINAMNSDNLRGWLGNNTYDALDDGDIGSELLGKLRHDLGTMRETFNQPNAANWQTMLFPIFDGRELHQARLNVKYLPDENNEPDKKIGTRFLLELDTSQFGEMQFDGLVHNTIPSKNFDLVVRSHTPLDDEMRADIRQIFNNAAEITGFKGDIDFATMREFPVKIFEQMLNKNLSSNIDHKGIEA